MPLAHPVIEEINARLRSFAHLPEEQRADKFHELRDSIKEEHQDLYARLVSHLHEPQQMNPEDVRRYFETEIASAYLHTGNLEDPKAIERLARAIEGLTPTGAPTLAEQIRRAHFDAAHNTAPVKPCGKVKSSFFSKF